MTQSTHFRSRHQPPKTRRSVHQPSSRHAHSHQGPCDPCRRPAASRSRRDCCTRPLHLRPRLAWLSTHLKTFTQAMASKSTNSKFLSSSCFQAGREQSFPALVLTRRPPLENRYGCSVPASPKTSAVNASSCAPVRHASPGRPALWQVCSRKVRKSQ